MKDPNFLSLQLPRSHLSCELGGEVDQVLHEQAHDPSGCRGELGQSARVKGEVNVLGPVEVRAPLLDPRQGSGRTSMNLMFK